MVEKNTLVDKVVQIRNIAIKNAEQKLLSKITETTRVTMLEDALLYYGIVKRNVEFYTERQAFVEWYHNALEQVKIKIIDFKDYRDGYYQIMELLEKDFNYKRMNINHKKKDLRTIDYAQVIDIKIFRNNI